MEYVEIPKRQLTSLFSSKDSKIPKVIDIIEKKKSVVSFDHAFPIPNVEISPPVKVNSSSCGDIQLKQLGHFYCDFDKKKKIVVNPFYKISETAFYNSFLLEKVVRYLMCFESVEAVYAGEMPSPSERNRHWRLCAADLGLDPPNKGITVSQALTPIQLSKFKDVLAKKEQDVLDFSKDEKEISLSSSYISTYGNPFKFKDIAIKGGKQISYWIAGRVLRKKVNAVEAVCFNPHKKLIYGLGIKQKTFYFPKDSREKASIEEAIPDKLLELMTSYLNAVENPKSKPLAATKAYKAFEDEAKKSLAANKKFKLN